MKERNILTFLVVIATAFSSFLFAQEYKYEIGGAAGISFYMGDANKTALYKNSHISGGFVFRYNQNLRWAYKANLIVGGVSGDTRTSGNVFPNGAQAQFSRTFYELGGQVEFNFFPYSDKYTYLGTRRFSPYVFTGIGLTAASGENSFFGVNIPFGVGLKYKLKDRLNIGFEFSFRKLFDDSFDKPYNNGFGLDNPYGIKSSALKNKDWYSLTMFSITWDFGKKCEQCMRIDY